jgi:teichuronic acid biosynthesis glycosyltransferase TuaC
MRTAEHHVADWRVSHGSPIRWSAIWSRTYSRSWVGNLVDFVHRDPGADVLVVTNMWPEPGRPVYGNFVKRQVESLRATGLRCDVLYIRGYRSSLAYPLAAVQFALSSLLWRGRYRLVHVHAAETGLAARFHVGTPVLCTYHGDDVLGTRDADGGLRTGARVRTMMVRAYSRLFTATITQSRAMGEVLPGRTRRRNRVVPNGIDRERFRPHERAEARRQLGWDNEPVALFACTKPESPAKRLWLARSACEAAGVRLHIADVEPHLMSVLMSASDCLLHTSAVEGSPMVVKEALMCNLPIVATPVGDIPERLEGVDPSWLCPPEAEAFARALRECAAAGRRSNGREVAADLAEERVAEQILELYREVSDLDGRAAV